MIPQSEGDNPRPHQPVIDAVRRWVERLVVDLNLCPFAKRELVKNRIRFVVTDSHCETHLLTVLEQELQRLEQDPSIATTLLIHPAVLRDFYAYNQFLDDADRLLERLALAGIYQIASFHPHYQFGGTEPADVENYTNRSPYPLLHLLREASLEHAIEQYPDVTQIPTDNVALMQRLGETHLRQLLHSCLHGSHRDAGDD